MADELKVQRLLCAVFPTRLERVAGFVAAAAYRVSDRGPTGWIGDRFDDLRVRSLRRRADRRVRRAKVPS